MSDSATPWAVALQSPLFMGFSGKNTRVGCRVLLHSLDLWPWVEYSSSLSSHLPHQEPLNTALDKGFVTLEGRVWLFVVQSLSRVRLFVTPWTPGFPSFTVSWTLLKLISIESMMPSNHLVLCRQSFPASGSFQRIRFDYSLRQETSSNSMADIFVPLRGLVASIPPHFQ